MADPKISIIVPVYNVEAYLEQCLGSIQKQIFQDYEVICVNDGSSDKSAEILQAYARRDDRFKIINKENRGYGHSMNLGIAAARGRYIGIVESDDYIEPAMFAKLYALAEEHDLDIARCNYYQISGAEQKKADLSYIPLNKIVCPLEYPAIFYQPPAIWANLYRRGMIRENEIKFLETPGASYQDTSFIFKAYALCRRFMFIDEPLLNYRTDNPNSSVNSRQKTFAVCAEYQEILSFAKRHKAVYEQMKTHIPFMRYACYAWNLARLSAPFRLPFLRQWSREIKRDYQEKRIDQEKFSARKLKRMWIIRHLPLFYKWRKKPL